MTNAHRFARRAGALTVLVLAAAASSCASASGGGSRDQGVEPLAPRPDLSWRVTTSYQTDLWLYGYAMLQPDTTLVPYFHRGYREAMVALRQRANVTSLLDSATDTLRARLAKDSRLVGGQFLPLYFKSWETMQQGIQSYLQTGTAAARDRRRPSNGRGGGFNPDAGREFAVIASSFAGDTDHVWLRTFFTAMKDESTRFYQSYWTEQQQERAPVRAAVDSLWSRVYFPKFRKYLGGTGQQDGEVVLALPLDGEGRTIGSPQEGVRVAVGYPDSVGDAITAVYVIAHEVIGTVANESIRDNTTPAEQRAGVADHYTSPAAVRGGELLLERVAPELVTGYQRHYLQAARATYASGGEREAFIRTFPLPPTILDGITHRLGTVLGGI